MRMSRGGAAAGTTGAAVLMLGGAITAFACTILPSTSLSEPYGVAGSNVQITGTSWPTPGSVNDTGPVVLHWDTINGPVLATARADSHGTLGPVTVRIPAGAEPGYHAIVSDIASGSPQARVRTVYQVIGSGGAAARQPRAALSGATTAPQPGIGAGALGLLAAMGVAGLMLTGAGTASVVRSHRRAPVASRVRRR